MRDFSACRPPQSGSQQPARPGFLDKGNDPQVLWIRTGLQFHLDSFAEALSFLQLSDLCELQHNRNVRQVPASVFSVQHLRFDAIESDRQIDVGVLVGIAIRFNTRSKNIPGFNAYLANADRDHRRSGSIVQDLVELLRIVSVRFAGSIHDELRSVCSL